MRAAGIRGGERVGLPGGLGALQPVAMERTLQLLQRETGIASGSFEIPCDSRGAERIA